MRGKFVAGNWKMNTDLAGGVALAKSLVDGIKADGAVTAGLASGKLRTAVCPPFPYILPVRDAIQGSKVELGAQNCYMEKPGAFTGEVAAAMLKDIGCGLVILGHSERRHKMGETDAQIKAKLVTAQAAGLEVILCLGETLAERQAEKTFSVLAEQIVGALGGLPVDTLGKLVIAYEPVWAIGTGVNATPQRPRNPVPARCGRGPGGRCQPRRQEVFAHFAGRRRLKSYLGWRRGRMMP